MIATITNQAIEKNEGILVHGLDTDPMNARAAREYIRSVGHYGALAVDGFNGNVERAHLLHH